MASRKLGRGLGDLSASEARISRGLESLIPSTPAPSDYEPEDLGDVVLIPRIAPSNLPRSPRNTPRGIPEDYVPVDDEEFEAYTGIEWVTPDDDPNNYGQGPRRSTRVAAHKFVPYGNLMNRAVGSQQTVSAGIRYGAVYVKFQNNRGRNGNVYRYDHVPDHVYQNFRNSTSKGTFINDFLNAFPYRPASDDPNASDL